MSHVFVSYSKKNKDYARRLADHLIAAGFDVWIDDRIDYGSQWETAIQKAIEDCAAFIVVMTPESRESQWVRTECEYTAQQGKPALPLLLAGGVFFRYVSVQYADVTDGSLPPDTFLSELEEYAPRRRGTGANVTPPEVSLKDAEEARPAVSRRPAPLVIGAALLATLLLIALMIILPRLNPNASNEATPGTAVSTANTPEGAQIIENNNAVPEASSNSDWEPVTHYFGEVEMALVPPGCFDGDERGEICIDAPFWIDRFEVSTSAFAQRAAYLTDRENAWEHDDQPRTNVTASESAAFCEWRGGRLPTPDEWEYAARGPDGWLYPWGDEFDDDGIAYAENSNGHPAFVYEGDDGESWVSALNMTGNVWEWTQPNEDGALVRRGGGYDTPEEMLTLDMSVSEAAGEWNAYTGFRCAMDYTDDTAVASSAPPPDCDNDWFFGDEYAAAGECPLSEATGIEGIVQRFDGGMIIGIPLPETGARFLLMTNEGAYHDISGQWDSGDAAIGACVFETTVGVYQILATHDEPVDPLGCPIQPVQEDYFDFQVADVSPGFVSYIGTSSGVVYRLSAATSRPDTEGEWRRVR